MKKNVFTTCFRVFTPLILALATLVPKKPGQIAIVILFCLWALILLMYVFHILNRNIKKSPQKRSTRTIKKLCETEVNVLSPKREKGITLSSEDMNIILRRGRKKVTHFPASGSLSVSGKSPYGASFCCKIYFLLSCNKVLNCMRI